ncbi:hypothetical protein CKO_01084 [Citrobacter koseri ATCC BAA-895]|uniref:Uncharacterized protein n=1 Tax=Citrobacter koseri (strain ATCC BAA-895 / CDC 4225-83 / SGSC4696) TaxID=290338 RepID=A8AFG4_CITK8|nr:hypothetical protein CKO_01084 [Citrobacter koseri ATCC BAA-895]
MPDGGVNALSSLRETATLTVICNDSQGMTHFRREMEHLLSVMPVTPPYY